MCLQQQSLQQQNADTATGRFHYPTVEQRPLHTTARFLDLGPKFYTCCCKVGWPLVADFVQLVTPSSTRNATMSSSCVRTPESGYFAAVRC